MALFSKRLERRIDRIESAVKASFEKVRQDMGPVQDWMRHAQEIEDYHERLAKWQQDEQAKILSRLAVQEALAGEASSRIAAVDSKADGVEPRLERLRELVERTRKEVAHQADNHFHIEKISKQLALLDGRMDGVERLQSAVDRLAKKVDGHDDVQSEVIDLRRNLATVEKRLVQAEKSAQHAEALSARIERLKEGMGLRGLATVENRLDQLQERLSQVVVKTPPRQKLVQRVVKKSHDYLRAMAISYIRKYQKISAIQLRDMMVEEQNLTSTSTFYRILEEIEQEEDIAVVREGREKVYLSQLRKHA